MPSDLDRVVSYAERVLPLAAVRLGKQYYYQSLPLCVMDAVFAFNARYATVQNVVAFYCRRYELRPFRPYGAPFPPTGDQESISEFCNKVKRLGVEGLADTVFENRQRTSARSGILKAEAVYRFASALRAHGVDSFQDAQKAFQDPALETEIRAIPGNVTGSRVRYFWMLAGSDDFVQPDHVVLGFLESALERPVNPDEAQPLIAQAARELRVKNFQMTPRLLDYAIWDHQRTQRLQGR